MKLQYCKAFAQNAITGLTAFPANLAAINNLFPDGSNPGCASGSNDTYSGVSTGMSLVMNQSIII